MIIRAEDRKQILTPNARGGDGTLDKRDYVLENMPENAKMFAEIKLEPGCSLGTHTHTGEYEVFFFHEGEVTLNDNGTERKMHPGDFAICYDGESHGLANRTDKARVAVCGHHQDQVRRPHDDLYLLSQGHLLEADGS